MPRARRGAARRQSKVRTFKRVQGFVGGRGNLLRTAKEVSIKAGVAAFRDRRRRKRDFRRLWITRIGIACRMRDITYSRFINGLVRANVVIDRKMMAEMAVSDPAGFDELVAVAKAHLDQAPAAD